MKALGHAVLVLVCAGATFLAQRQGEARSTGDRPRVGALPAIPFLEAASLGYHEVAADLAWLQAVQYYGEHRQGGNDLAEFDHFLLAVNTLDPRFEHPYVFGAFVLAHERADLPAALDLLRRGARANPESANLLFEMGFLTFVQGGDTETALRYLAQSARAPGGADRARRFMAHLNLRLGRLETSWVLWNDLQNSTTDERMKIIATENMRRLEERIRAARAAAPSAETPPAASLPPAPLPSAPPPAAPEGGSL